MSSVHAPIPLLDGQMAAGVLVNFGEAVVVKPKQRKQHKPKPCFASVLAEMQASLASMSNAVTTLLLLEQEEGVVAAATTKPKPKPQARSSRKTVRPASSRTQRKKKQQRVVVESAPVPAPKPRAEIDAAVKRSLYLVDKYGYDDEDAAASTVRSETQMSAVWREASQLRRGFRAHLSRDLKGGLKRVVERMKTAYLGFKGLKNVVSDDDSEYSACESNPVEESGFSSDGGDE